MKIKLKLFELDKPASDGSIIPRKVFEKYLSSEDYINRVNSKMFIGGVTHRDRNSPNAQDQLGEFDDLLVRGNITHYFSSMSIGADNFVYADAEVMDDPNDYEGESKQLMLTIVRLLKNGIMPPVSIVVRAYWEEDVADEIVFIHGADFTLSPGYSGAQVIGIKA